MEMEEKRKKTEEGWRQRENGGGEGMKMKERWSRAWGSASIVCILSWSSLCPATYGAAPSPRNSPQPRDLL